MATTDYGTISQRTAAWAAKEMLSHAEPILVLQKFAQSKPLPKNKADNVKFRRPVPFTVSTTGLTEGVTPTAQALTYADVPAQIAQYGAVTEITDYVADLAEDPVLKDASILSGEQAAETLEMVTYGTLNAATNVFYGSAVANRVSVVNAITLNDQRRITRALKAQRAKKITSMVSGSPNYSTEPVDAAFIAFAHTDCEADIRDMTGFVPVEKYGQMKALPYEIGKVEDVRYICTPLMDPVADAGGLASTNGLISTTGTNADIYHVIYVAKEAYGCVPLKGAGAITPTVLNPGTPSKSDPLGQMGYVGWKTYFTCVILNQAWMGRLEVGVSDI
jgi:N4-gp56 family major capsid protein